ncbi:AcrR family transcriptional regulator [Rhodoblastus sphagnicola]|nr:TetR/AcrR family transcriptional regulator [Rhodoblastus sphagnicola]MBB4199248.1 AcrR family transcriptional regulator [Rhodoblastus sphagnicola]
MSIEIESQIENPDRVEWRREQVVNAAVERFAQNGYHATTIKEIAETAGVSPGLIYTYVKDKEDVLLLVFLAAFRRYQTEIPQKIAGISDPLQKFRAAFRAYCECVGSNLDSTLIAYQESKSLKPGRRKIVQDLEIKTNALISEPLQDCIKAGYIACANVDLATFHLILHAHGWALKNWFFRERISLNGYIEEGLSRFLNSSLTPSGWERWRAEAKG